MHYLLKQSSIFVTFFLLFWHVTWLLGGVCSARPQTTAPGTPPANETKVEKVDRYQEQTEKLILDTAEWLDSFFGTPTYLAEVNKTYLRLQLTGFLEDGESFDTNARFTLRLSLPNTEKRFRLTFASSPDYVDRQDGLSDDTGVQQIEEVDNNLAGALEYFLLDRKRHNLKFSAGATIRNSSLVGFGSTRYRYQVDVRRWTTRFVQRLRWYTDEGWDARSTLDFERPVFDKLFFRTTPALKWKQEREGSEYSWTTSLFHPLSEKHALEYQFNNYFDTEIEGRLRESNVRVRYRRQIWRKWLVCEVAPQLAWYEARDFKTVAGIAVRLEIWLGRYKKTV